MRFAENGIPEFKVYMKITCNYVSKALGRAVDIVMAIPSPVYPDTLGYGGKAEFSPVAKYPVLFLLGGIGNDCNSIFDYTRVQLYAEEYNIAIVSVSGENKFYADLGGENFSEFLEEELPVLVRGYFPVSERTEDTFIAGLSMGGYGALLHYLKRPERFYAVGCFSGAVGKFDYAETEEGKDYNIYNLLDQRIKSNKKPENIYLACGSEDFIKECSLKLKQYLEDKKVKFSWKEVSGYGHEWRFWDKQIEEFLKWLPRTDFYNDKHRKV